MKKTKLLIWLLVVSTLFGMTTIHVLADDERTIPKEEYTDVPSEGESNTDIPIITPSENEGWLISPNSNADNIEKENTNQISLLPIIGAIGLLGMLGCILIYLKK